MINALKCITSAALTNDINTTVLNEKELKHLLITDYSESFVAYNNNNKLFKGMPFDANQMCICKPNYRISQYTSNICTRLFSDILPSWKYWPKRNHSFICTNSSDIAEGYDGNIFIVFPKNGTELAVCPENDIWWSFKKLVKNNYTIKTFNAAFIKLLSNVLNIDKSTIEINFLKNNNDELASLLKQAEICIKNGDIVINEVKHIRNADLIDNIVLSIEYTEKTMIEILDDIFNPISNDFIRCELATA